jgi:serine/threonine protein kinase
VKGAPELMERTTRASLRDVFSEAAEIADPAARAAFLDSACQGDAALRARVERLLLADSQAGEFLSERADSTERFPEKVGERIGRYRLRERIGRGGCGVVYLAEQEEPVRREVALKVIKLGMDTRSVVARFEAERQALALMDHPNIARVLDAGATETGRPFFVMELVRGVPITEYCEQNGVSFRQRLELFIQVCQAVQHAHQKGIIHRDLKPSNILVATQDGMPAPKVIDFGIAKATEQRLTEHTALTSLNQFIGTPAYMSPEQVGLGECDVDTRSDIYSLGVILYELVAGRPPFAPKDLAQAGLDEMRRIIREVDPPRPSTTITRNLDSNRLPSTRGPSREQLAAVRGDLDWIVMKCLEKDRARRYETANSLATDIRRHLDNETIGARPPTALYRFQKIVRRNPRVAALAALLLLALASGLSGVLFMNVRLTSANGQKDLANARLAAKLHDFEWQKVEDLASAGKRGDALALLSDFLRNNPHDEVAAARVFSMLNSGNFGLPKAPPFQHSAGVNSVAVSADGRRAHGG